MILFRVHPAIPGTVTLLVLRTLEVDKEWDGHVSVASEHRVLMVRSGRPKTR